MRLLSVLLLILGLALAPSALAAQKQAPKTPATTSAKPVEQIYLESEVDIDDADQVARDKDGIPISGTIQNFYPNGRLAWETQWVNGKLHGITRGYDENRKLREETTWVDGKLNGLARWYDEKGNLRRETMYEGDKDQAAPAEVQESDAANEPASQSKAQEESPQTQENKPKEAE